jgi:hypothetical protein
VARASLRRRAFAADPLVVERDVVDPDGEPGRRALVVVPADTQLVELVGDVGALVVAGAVLERELLLAIPVKGEALVGRLDVILRAVPRPVERVIVLGFAPELALPDDLDVVDPVVA